MTSWTVQPLDSFRLGNYQFPLPCYLCEENNLFDAATCRRCFAPLALTRSAMQKKGVRPNLVLPIGADDVGKSVYMGTLLDILSRERDRSDITTHSASSVTLQHQVMSALSQGVFPERTDENPEKWIWAQCRLQRRSRTEPLNVFFPDMSGATALNEIDQPNTYRSVSGAFQKAGAAMLFVDASRVRQGDEDEQFLALKLLSFLGEMIERGAEKGAGKGRRSATPAVPPVAIVLAKADQCEECQQDPREFARRNLPGLWQHCHDRFPVHEWFPVSIVGACGRSYYDSGKYEKIPLRIEPRGVMEPFRWTIRQIMN